MVRCVSWQKIRNRVSRDVQESSSSTDELHTCGLSDAHTDLEVVLLGIEELAEPSAVAPYHCIESFIQH